MTLRIFQDWFFMVILLLDFVGKQEKIQSIDELIF